MPERPQGLYVAVFSEILCLLHTKVCRLPGCDDSLSLYTACAYLFYSRWQLAVQLSVKPAICGMLTTSTCFQCTFCVLKPKAEKAA